MTPRTFAVWKKSYCPDSDREADCLAAWNAALDAAEQVAATICQHSKKSHCEFGKAPQLIAEAIRQLRTEARG